MASKQRGLFAAGQRHNSSRILASIHLSKYSESFLLLAMNLENKLCLTLSQIGKKWISKRGRGDGKVNKFFVIDVVILRKFLRHFWPF